MSDSDDDDDEHVSAPIEDDVDFVDRMSTVRDDFRDLRNAVSHWIGCHGFTDGATCITVSKTPTAEGDAVIHRSILALVNCFDGRYAVPVFSRIPQPYEAVWARPLVALVCPTKHLKFPIRMFHQDLPALTALLQDAPSELDLRLRLEDITVEQPEGTTALARFAFTEPISRLLLWFDVRGPGSLVNEVDYKGWNVNPSRPIFTVVDSKKHLRLAEAAMMSPSLSELHLGTSVPLNEMTELFRDRRLLHPRHLIVRLRDVDYVDVFLRDCFPHLRSEVVTLKLEEKPYAKHSPKIKKKLETAVNANRYVEMLELDKLKVDADRCNSRLQRTILDGFVSVYLAAMRAVQQHPLSNSLGVVLREMTQRFVNGDTHPDNLVTARDEKDNVLSRLDLTKDSKWERIAYTKFAKRNEVYIEPPHRSDHKRRRDEEGGGQQAPMQE
jgi:hypothetical protein